MKKEKLFLFGEVKSAEDGTITVIASDETVDRYGEVIKVDGWDLKNFKKNPVMLVSHNWDELPIGKWVKPRVEEKKLMFDAVFSEASAKAKEVMSLVQEGILNTVSVGLIVKERDVNDPTIITKAELLEVSWVSLPANPNAMALAMAKGLRFGMFDDDKDEDKEKKELADMLVTVECKDLPEVMELIKKLEAQVNVYKPMLLEYRKLIRGIRRRLGLDKDVENEMSGLLEAKEKLIALLETNSVQKQVNPVEDPAKVENLQLAQAIKEIAQKEVKEALGKYII